MRFFHNRTVIFAMGSLIAVIAAACGTGAPEPALSPSPTAASTVQPVEAGVSSAASRAAEAYNSNVAMYRLFSGLGDPFELDSIERQRDQRLQVVKNIGEEGDLSQVPVMIEAMRFLGSEEERDAFAEVLRVFTGQNLGGNDWPEWSEWYGRNADEFPPPSEYIEWKISLLSQISPRFAGFLGPAKEFSRINVTEIQWGGVLPDGIPDLQSPPSIPADEAEYLGFEERVFGVSINGEHRAYPLRITNPHEMVNDALGGEPIALSW